MLFGEVSDSIEDFNAIHGTRVRKGTQINTLVAILIVVSAVLTGILLYLFPFVEAGKVAVNSTAPLVFLQSLTLVMIVLYLRHQINSCKSKRANMRLIWLHLINFTILAIIGIPILLVDFDVWIFNFLFTEIANCAYIFVSDYLQIFVLFLIGKFALNMQRPDIRDHVLGKQVPFAVFI